MTPTPEAQDRLRRYLLGQLTDGAREEIEQDLLSDQGLFEELLVLEDEIMDEYLGGKLNPDDRTPFEQHFLASPERQKKLRFARALKRYVTLASPQEASASRLLPVFWMSQTMLYRVAAAVAIVAIVGGVLWFRRQQSSAPHTFATLNLNISQSTRAEGSQAPKIQLPLSEDALRIILRLPDTSPPATHYRVELQNDSGEKRSLETVAQDEQSVTVVIPAAELKRALYSLKLFAVRPDGGEQRVNGSYLFTVE